MCIGLTACCCAAADARNPFFLFHVGDHVTDVGKPPHRARIFKGARDAPTAAAWVLMGAGLWYSR